MELHETVGVIQALVMARDGWTMTVFLEAMNWGRKTEDYVGGRYVLLKSDPLRFWESLGFADRCQFARSIRIISLRIDGKATTKHQSTGS